MPSRLGTRPDQLNGKQKSAIWLVRTLLFAAVACVLLASHQLYSRLSADGDVTDQEPRAESQEQSRFNFYNFAGSQSLRSLAWLAPPSITHKRLDVNPWPDAYFVPWVEGMDPLPESHGPDSDDWKNSFAICSIMKDENVTDVREWLTYYRWMGVDHVFLTDNNSEGGKDMVKQLRSEFPPWFLTVQIEEMEHAQMKHYAWCAEEQRDKYNWIGFFDLDEYLYVNGNDLPSFMDNYKDNAALSVHWIWVGPDGRTTRPDTGGVLPYYTMCSEEADRHVKTIVNTYFLEGVDIHPHNFRYRDNRTSVDENFDHIASMWKGKWEFKRKGGTDDQCTAMAKKPGKDFDQKCFSSAGATREPATANKIALYHFATKSLDDFSQKMHRGSGMSKGAKGMDYFAEISRLQSRSEWCSFPSSAAAQCCEELYPEALKNLTRR